MRLGIADHFGWAVVVSASADHRVIDRRRIELLGPDVPNAPVHHGIEQLDDDDAEALIDRVRASAVRATTASLDELAADLPTTVGSMSLRALPSDFPTDITTLRRAPYEARADAVMYREVLVEVARARGWDVHFYVAKAVEADAVSRLGERADQVLHGPRKALGPPWTKDHRMALAATVLVD